MKNAKLSIRLLCAALMVAMLASMAVGCKKADPVIAQMKEHVFKVEYFNMPAELQNLDSVRVYNGRLYGIAYLNSQDSSYGQELISMNLDGSDFKTIPYKQEAPKDASGDIKQDSGSYISSMTMDQSGTIYLVTNTYSSYQDTTGNWVYNEKFEIIIIGQDGKEQGRIDMSQYAQEGQYFYIQKLLPFRDSLLALTGDSLWAFDKTGKDQFKVSIEGWIQDIMVLGDKAVVSMYSDSESKYVYKELDIQTQSLKDSTFSLPGEAYRYTTILGPDENLYLNDTMALYRYDFATQQTTELLNWIDSDIDASSVYSVVPISDTEIICTGYNSMEGKPEITRLTKVNPEDVVEKKVLTMAVNWMDYDLRRAVIAFNKANAEYRIKVTDYSQYNTQDDYMAGSTKLNTDIISGNVPDILYVTSDMQVDSYISKGLFADLYKLMDGDDSFNREDYLQNIFDAYSRDGKLYTLIPSFSIYTVMGKSSVLGAEPGWTMDDLNALMATLPEGTKSFANATRNTILTMSLFMSIDQYINKDTGECYFNTGDFAKLLEFANTFPSEQELYGDPSVYSSTKRAVAVAAGDYGYYDEYKSEEDMIREGSAVLQMTYFDDIFMYKNKQFQYGDEPVFIGFPTTQGNGSTIMGRMEFALSAKSKNIQGAWQFVKYFLSDEYQDTITYGFPVKKSRLDALGEAAMKPYSWTDYEGNVYEQPRYIWTNGQSVEIENMNQTEVDKVKNYIMSVNTVMRYDTTMMGLITDDSDAYFNGQKSAQETANTIQSRVQNYIAEKR